MLATRPSAQTHLSAEQEAVRASTAVRSRVCLPNVAKRWATVAHVSRCKLSARATRPSAYPSLPAARIISARPALYWASATEVASRANAEASSSPSSRTEVSASDAMSTQAARHCSGGRRNFSRRAVCKTNEQRGADSARAPQVSGAYAAGPISTAAQTGVRLASWPNGRLKLSFLCRLRVANAWGSPLGNPTIGSKRGNLKAGGRPGGAAVWPLAYANAKQEGGRPTQTAQSLGAPTSAGRPAADSSCRGTRPRANPICPSNWAG